MEVLHMLNLFSSYLDWSGPITKKYKFIIANRADLVISDYHYTTKMLQCAICHVLYEFLFLLYFWKVVMGCVQKEIRNRYNILQMSAVACWKPQVPKEAKAAEKLFIFHHFQLHKSQYNT